MQPDPHDPRTYVMWKDIGPTPYGFSAAYGLERFDDDLPEALEEELMRRVHRDIGAVVEQCRAKGIDPVRCPLHFTMMLDAYTLVVRLTYQPLQTGVWTIN